MLRDGASAQYGSDAIAGVINFLLKDDRSGGSLAFNTGTYRAGDGDAYTMAGNVGLPLGDTGFVNLSLEYGNADPTNRSVQRADAAALIAAGNTDVADPAQIEGLALDPDLQGGHVGEIRLPQGARLIPLLEEHLLRAPRQRAPALDSSLQRAELTVLKATRLTPLQVRKQRLGLIRATRWGRGVIPKETGIVPSADPAGT